MSNLLKHLLIENLDTYYKLNHKNIIKGIPLNEESKYDENDYLNIVYESLNSNNVEELIKNIVDIDKKIIKIYFFS